MKEKTEITVIRNDMFTEDRTEIKSLIYVVRGRQVMLDSDLAKLYQIETKVLNQAVKRNISRFPEHYRFQLTADEYANLKSQFVTSSLDAAENNYGGRRKLPFAYTEQGIAMLSSVLRSDVAIQVNIRIIDTFVEVRKYMADTMYLFKKVNDIETRQLEADLNRKSFEKKTEEQFTEVFKYIADHEEDNQKIFFDGQIFDAFSLMTDLIRQADKEIILIDGYVDVVTLNILAKKKNGVNITLYTLPKSRLSTQDITNFNAQYPTLEVKETKAFHDRFLLIDKKSGYHIGASIKDAGKKCFAINRIEDVGVIDDLIQRAQITSEP